MIARSEFALNLQSVSKGQLGPSNEASFGNRGGLKILSEKNDSSCKKTMKKIRNDARVDECKAQIVVSGTEDRRL